MKRNILILILLLAGNGLVRAQQVVSGTVTDGRHPIAGANVFVKGTTDGCLTDSLGRFSFSTLKADSAQLMITCIGYDNAERDWQKGHKPLAIRLHERTTTIDEVVVTGSTFQFGQANGVKQMGALDVVLDGGSCGDIVSALQSLPGTQKVGEDGKLYVRGGSSEECQTYINGMHVLRPYSTTASNSPSRGRFSPFLFKGIAFSLGGYDAEYGQALSSVLPMETTDAPVSDKLGVSASLIDWNIGGTKATKQGCWSMNATYMDLGMYNRLFPDRRNWRKPYRQLSFETQWKTQPTPSSVWKSYLGFDRTTLSLDTDGRTLRLEENNLYLNSVAKGSAKGRVTWFAGLAAGMVWQDISDALLHGDRYRHRTGELHVKTKASKTLTAWMKGTIGMESFFRYQWLDYRLHDRLHDSKGYLLPALFAMMQYKLFKGCSAEASLRTEYSSLSHRWTVLPRLLLNYNPSRRWLLSLSAGSYTQEAADTILVRSLAPSRSSLARHYIAGLQYSFGNTLVRIESYYKRYSRLPLLRQGLYTADGHGKSQGFDLFIDDRSLMPNLYTMLSYSYNNSRRRYLDYLTEQQPQYVSRHNLRLALKYSIGIFGLGLTESFASGRKSEGRTTPYYNSLDASITCLASKHVIVYTSLSNLLGRQNIYGYRGGEPITNGSDRFLYIGIFVSLKSNKAYDIANF
jgi:hypothetical protein